MTIEELLQQERKFEDWTFEAESVPGGFFNAAERFPDKPAQQFKGGTSDRSMTDSVFAEPPAGEYSSITYSDLAGILSNLGTGFRELGVMPGDRVAIYADTRMEWAQADFAIQAIGGVVSTVYTESAPDQVRYLVSDAGAMGVVAENEELLETLEGIEDDLDTDLEFVVLMDEYSGDREDVHTLAEVHDLGAEQYDADEFESWLDAIDEDDLCSLIYTSGTTGDPKGVELTHANFKSALGQTRKRVGPRPDKPDDMAVIDEHALFLSFLPLAHALERFNHFGHLRAGGTIAYAESVDTVAEDLEQVSPTIVSGVPRVWERLYDAVRSEAAESPVKKRIFEWAIDTGLEYDATDDPGPLLRAKFAVADRLVFTKVREALGGEVELLTSGGGTLSADLARLYRAMGLIILEGYGLTETAPIVSIDFPEDIRIGTLGYPGVDVETKVDPTVTTPDQREGTEGEVGELLVKGPNVTSGYWNKTERTSKAFTQDGWFRTGDIVAIDDEGFLRFVDRVKNLIVLDTGKNVAPERIEDAFATDPRVDQILVIGQDQKFIAAMVVPNFEELDSWAEAEEIELPEGREAQCADERVRKWVGESVERINEGFADFEQVKEFRLVPEEWTADNDMLTPSLKKRRHNITDRYDALIEDIYGDGGEEEKRPQPA